MIKSKTKNKIETNEPEACWTEELVFPHYHFAFCAAVAIIRGFAQRGENLLNPTIGRMRELIAASNERTFPREQTRMARAMDVGSPYDTEKEAVYDASEYLWNGEYSLSPEEALRRLTEVDGYFPSWEAKIFDKPMDRYEKSNYAKTVEYLDRFDAPTVSHIKRKSDRRSIDLSRAFLLSERYMHDNDVPPYMAERINPMNEIDSTVLCVERAILDMFEGDDAIPNPLIALRQLDDEGCAFFACEAARKQALPVLEDLACRVWHHRASVGIYDLISFLMLQPDGGLNDLALIETYAELLGGARREADDAEPHMPIQLSLDWELGLD